MQKNNHTTKFLKNMSFPASGKMSSQLRLLAFGLPGVVALFLQDSVPDDVIFDLYHESHSATCNKTCYNSTVLSTRNFQCIKEHVFLSDHLFKEVHPILIYSPCYVRALSSSFQKNQRTSEAKGHHKPFKP